MCYPRGLSDDVVYIIFLKSITQSYKYKLHNICKVIDSKSLKKYKKHMYQEINMYQEICSCFFKRQKEEEGETIFKQYNQE